MTPQLPPTPVPAPLRRRPIFTPYVLGWTICGTLAVGYIATMFLAPDVLEDLAPASAVIAEPQSNLGQGASARVAADVGALKDSITQVQLELSKIKTEVASHGERAKALNAQLAALEQKLADRQKGAIETAQPAPPAAPQPQAEPPQQEAVAPQPEIPAELKVEAPVSTIDLPGHGQVRIKAPAPAPAQPKLINATAAPGAQPALATGSVTLPPEVAAAAAALPPPPDAGAAAKTAFTTAIIRPPKPVGIHLSTGASVDSLRLSWSLLADRHGDALKNLEARYVSTGDEANPNFDLIAGPIKSKAEAQKVCKALAAKNVPCKVGDFAGEAL